MKKKVIDKKITILLALLGIALILLILHLNFDLTGLVISEQRGNSRYLFYDGPRVSPNMLYLDTCFPAGEVIPPLPDAKCCDGLRLLGIDDGAQEGCNFVIGSGLCSDCGNLRCKCGEDNCNCPEDCNRPPKVL